MMTKEQFLKRKARRRRRKMIMRLSLVVAGLVLAVALLWFAVRGIVKLVKSAFVSSEAQGETMTPDQFDTPTPTPTYVPVQGLVRRDPKDNHRLVLRIKSDYEDNETVNVRSNPSQKSSKVDTLKVGDKFDISCSYEDPDHKGYLGFYGSELNVPGNIVWVYSLYCDVDDVMEPWAATLPYDYGYTKKYGKSKVTIRSKDGNADANVRSIPWEDGDSSYGRISVNTTFTAGTVYVSGDQQWYGFPAVALGHEIQTVLHDPDGIIWIYANYCIIDPQ